MLAIPAMVAICCSGGVLPAFRSRDGEQQQQQTQQSWAVGRRSSSTSPTFARRRRAAAKEAKQRPVLFWREKILARFF